MTSVGCHEWRMLEDSVTDEGKEHCVIWESAENVLYIGYSMS